nr:hypothetical protein [Hydrococcus rivularis]
MKLRKKIADRSIQERVASMQPTHRYHSIAHKMKAILPIHDGKSY